MNNGTGIYLLYFGQSPKQVYIGSSRNITERKSIHLSELRANRHHSVSLQDAFNKYGQDDMIMKVLEVLPDNISDVNLRKRETSWVSEYDSFKHGYNEKIPYSKRPPRSNRHHKHSVFVDNDLWNRVKDKYSIVTLSKLVQIFFTQLDNDEIELTTDGFIFKEKSTLKND